MKKWLALFQDKPCWSHRHAANRVVRVQLLQTGTPRTLGPGSHKPATSMGKQPASPRPSAPVWEHRQIVHWSIGSTAT